MSKVDFAKARSILRVAKAFARLSKDTTKIGCLGYKDNRLMCGGVNGYPPGFDDTDKRNRLKKVIHAEANCITLAGKFGITLDTLYVYGLPPCSDCLKMAVAAGIKRIYFQSAYDKTGKWRKSFMSVYPLFVNTIDVKEVA